MMKKLAHAITVALLAMALAAMAGCAQPGATKEDAATQNRAYMSAANTAMMQLNEDLAPFGEAAAAGDVVTMEQVAAKAYRDLDAFKEISAPEAMKDIHAEYSAGCDDLRAALESYLQLYRDSADTADKAFNAQVEAIQKQYDSGIAHLQAGDKLVTELSGALPSSSSSAGGSSSAATSSSSSSAN